MCIRDSYNTASGVYALYLNTTGNFNTASGVQALRANTTGNYNTASGAWALYDNTTGNSNAASGNGALYWNTTGSYNTASGMQALYYNTTGFYNTALGNGAGQNLTTGNSNIDIGNAGVAAEGNTIRIGDFNQTRTFISGIRDVTTGSANAITVMIDSNGQLGTVSSSIRYKEDVNDMGNLTSRLFGLRPVTFRYKTQPAGVHFGLIAEEVDQVMPELVVRGKDGQIETVAYHELPPMLLNEMQKQQKMITKQQEQLSTQQEQLSTQQSHIEVLQAKTARIEALEAENQGQKAENASLKRQIDEIRTMLNLRK